MITCPYCNKLIDPEDIAKQMGSHGGEKTLKKYGKDYFKRISRMAVKARWGK